MLRLDDANATPCSSLLPLENRVLIITGASAIARHLASLGTKLILSYSSNSTQTDLLATEINNSSYSSQHPKVISIKANVSDPDQVKSLFDQAEKPGFGAYAASKEVETTMRILAKELKGTGITANCVAPGPIATDMFYAGKGEEQIKNVIDECPLSRLGETKGVAPVVGFLTGDASEWVNGQVIRVNGGYVYV
ncbi:hypothetical protein MKX01_041115 [Papaver californicum]|nr:hypothetical protein MKX01_041115 [Papaver californicum]